MSVDMEPPKKNIDPLNELKKLFDSNGIKYNKSYNKNGTCFFRFLGAKETLDKVIRLLGDKYDILDSGVPEEIVYEEDKDGNPLNIIKRGDDGRSIRRDKGISFIYVKKK